MRTIVLRIMGLMLALAFLATPLSALAAPQITISPGSGAVNDDFNVAGGGFDPNVAYTFRVQSQDRQITVANSTTFVRVAADGTFANTFRITNPARAGSTYFGEVLTADTQTVVAGATFVLTGAAATPSAAPSPSPTTVAPTATAPTATAPVAPTAIATVAPTTVAPTATAVAPTAVAPTAVVPTAVPPTVAPTQTPRPAPTATMPTMPGLPNTGGGGMSGGDGGLLVGLGLVVSAAIAFGVARRRRAA